MYNSHINNTVWRNAGWAWVGVGGGGGGGEYRATPLASAGMGVWGVGGGVEQRATPLASIVHRPETFYIFRIYGVFIKF